MNDTIPAFEQLIEPSAVQFTFDAPGWYVVEVILLASVLAGCFFAWRRYRRNRYRREALQWLRDEEQRLTQSGEYPLLVYTAHMLVKRVAMLRYGREVSSLRGKEWLYYINKTWHSAFTDDDVQLFDALYMSDENFEAGRVNSFINKTKHWIKTHRYEL